DWREFVEASSLVERTLRQDPNGTYGRMDFATRDRYRHVVEKVARSTVRERHGAISELDVARRAVELARSTAASQGPDDRAAHVGFYLIGKGLPQLEQKTRARLSTSDALHRLAGRFPLFLYLSPILLITAILIAGSIEAAQN